jgi:hypothetical protein
MKIVSALALAAAFTASASAFALTPSDLYGSPATGAAASRQVVVDSHTRYVNVKHGDVVTFSNGAETVTWYFDGIDSTIPLARIFPAAAAQNVEIYVEPESQA